MVPTERNTHVKYQNSSNHCCSKVISKVKVLERRTEWQTGQKQTKTTLPLPVRGFKFWPIHSTHGHWAVRVLLFFYLYSAFMDIDQLGFWRLLVAPWINLTFRQSHRPLYIRWLKTEKCFLKVVYSSISFNAGFSNIYPRPPAVRQSSGVRQVRLPSRPAYHLKPTTPLIKLRNICIFQVFLFLNIFL